jgi:hypothetical protein
MGLPERNELYQFPVLQRSEIMTVTPDMAKEWLLNNTSNRPIRAQHVNALAVSITHGEWVVSHQGIAFSTGGTLLDGQHRLKAIIEADLPVQMLVTTGVNESAYKVLDCGVKRTIADLAHLDKKTAEVCRLIGCLLKMNKANVGVSISAAFALEIANTGVADTSSRLLATCNTATRYFASCPIRTAAIISIMRGWSEEYVLNLYKDLCLYNTDDLPTIGKALIKQVGIGAASAKDSPFQSLARGFVVFDERNKNKSRIVITDDFFSGTTTFVRKFMSDLGVFI